MQGAEFSGRMVENIPQKIRQALQIPTCIQSEHQRLLSLHCKFSTKITVLRENTLGLKHNKALMPVGIGLLNMPTRNKNIHRSKT